MDGGVCDIFPLALILLPLLPTLTVIPERFENGHHCQQRAFAPRPTCGEMRELLSGTQFIIPLSLPPCSVTRRSYFRFAGSQTHRTKANLRPERNTITP